MSTTTDRLTAEAEVVARVTLTFDPPLPLTVKSKPWLIASLYVDDVNWHPHGSAFGYAIVRGTMTDRGATSPEVTLLVMEADLPLVVVMRIRREARKAISAASDEVWQA